MRVFDFIFSSSEFYRKMIGGIWLYIHIIDGRPALTTYKGWVRYGYKTKKKYWVDTIESYNNMVPKEIKAFHYNLK